MMLKTFSEWAEDLQEQMPVQPTQQQQMAIDPKNAASLVQGTRAMAGESGQKGRAATGALLNVVNTLSQSGPEGLQKSKRVIAAMMQAVNGLQDLDPGVKDQLVNGIRQMAQGIKAMGQSQPQQGNATNPQQQATQQTVPKSSANAGLAAQGQPQA